MLSINERTGGMPEALRELKASASAEVRVAMPGIIQGFNAEAQTVSVQPAIRERVEGAGATEDMELPLLVDVPVVMPRAGGYSLVFAPVAGDECLVVFGDICIDSWWQNGGVQNQAEARRHDLSDGFAILGTWSQPRKCAMPSEGVRLQNDAGTAGISITGNTVNIFGTVRINGSGV